MGSSGIWSHGNFRYLFAARVADAAGNAIAPVALAFAILDLTGSVADIGLVVGARSAALVLFLLLGGVIADRWSRSVVLVWSNGVSSVTQAIVATLILTGNATIPALIALSVLNGAAGAVSFPAADALIPETVPKDLLQTANATTSSGTNVVNIAALVGGAALVAAVGPGWGLAIDAGSFALTAVLFGRLSLPPRPIAASGSTLLAELREGWGAFIGYEWIWPVVLGALVINAAWSGAVSIVGPAIADESIGRAGWGWVLGCQAAGMLVASLALARGKWPLRISSSLPFAGLPALLVLALAVSTELAVLAVAAAVSGIGFVVFSVAWSTNVQGYVSTDRLSRVYSWDMTGSMVALPIGQIAAGSAVVLLGTRPTLFVLAGLLIVPIIVLVSVPAVRRLPAPTQEPRLREA